MNKNEIKSILTEKWNERKDADYDSLRLDRERLRFLLHPVFSHEVRVDGKLITSVEDIDALAKENGKYFDRQDWYTPTVKI